LGNYSLRNLFITIVISKEKKKACRLRKKSRLAAGDKELKRAICGVALHPLSLRRTGKYASFRRICAPCI